MEPCRSDLLRLWEDFKEDDVEDGSRGQRHDDLDRHRARVVLRAAVDEVADGESQGGRGGKDAYRYEGVEVTDAGAHHFDANGEGDNKLNEH